MVTSSTNLASAAVFPVAFCCAWPLLAALKPTVFTVTRFCDAYNPSIISTHASADSFAPMGFRHIRVEGTIAPRAEGVGVKLARHTSPQLYELVASISFSPDGDNEYIPRHCAGFSQVITLLACARGAAW